MRRPSRGFCCTGLDETALQEEAAPVRFPFPGHHGLEPNPATFCGQALRVLEHPVADAAIPQSRPHDELLDGADPALQPQDRPRRQ
jgi:hypothetical protein